MERKHEQESRDSQDDKYNIAPVAMRKDDEILENCDCSE
jgi:hypothetical protein